MKGDFWLYYQICNSDGYFKIQCDGVVTNFNSLRYSILNFISLILNFLALHRLQIPVISVRRIEISVDKRLINKLLTLVRFNYEFYYLILHTLKEAVCLLEMFYELINR